LHQLRHSRTQSSRVSEVGEQGRRGVPPEGGGSIWTIRAVETEFTRQNGECDEIGSPAGARGSAGPWTTMSRSTRASLTEAWPVWHALGKCSVRVLIPQATTHAGATRLSIRQRKQWCGGKKQKCGN
jgi:hypothetical protein